jgi:hypothetical protein
MDGPALAEPLLLQSMATTQHEEQPTESLLQSTVNTASQQFILQFRRRWALQCRPSLMLRFQKEIVGSSQFPLSRTTLQDSLLQSAVKKARHGASWSSVIETTARCVNALYKAPPQEAPAIISKLIDSARSLATKISTRYETDEFVTVLHEFMEIRALRMACLNLLDRGLVTSSTDDPFWCRQTPRDRDDSINILTDSLDRIAAQSTRLRQQLIDFRAEPGQATNASDDRK